MEDNTPPTIPEEPRKPSRTEELRRIIEEYLAEQREIIRKLRQRLFH